MSGETKVGELIEKFESQAELCELIHLHSGKTTTVRWNNKPKRRMDRNKERIRQLVGMPTSLMTSPMVTTLPNPSTNTMSTIVPTGTTTYEIPTIMTTLFL